MKIIDGIFVICVGLILGMSFGMGLMELHIKHLAVEHKAAHYELNPTNGVSTWHWNQ